MCTATSISSNPPNADAQGVFHYPPELLQLLKDTIPLLCASKRDVILFFLGAGVPESWLADMKKQVETCRTSISKFSIAQDVLEKLNLERENHLRELHEVVRWVTGFEDFSTCRPTDRLKAMELVAEVRRVADVKDAFTRMCIDTEMEAKKAKAEAERKTQGATQEQERIQCIMKDLFALLGEPDPIRRAGPFPQHLSPVNHGAVPNESPLFDFLAVPQPSDISEPCRDWVAELEDLFGSRHPRMVDQGKGNAVVPDDREELLRQPILVPDFHGPPMVLR